MKKYLLNILAILLIIYPVYWSISFLPRVISYFDPSNTAVVIAGIAFTMSMILLAITGIGLLLKKNWSIPTYWISLLIILLLTVVYKTVTPLVNSYVFLLLNIIVATLVSTQWKKLGSN